MTLIILAVILIVAFGLVYYFVIWDGPFFITPVETSYEINDTAVDLKDAIEISEEESIEVTDKGEFDISKAGEYLITYKVTNERNRTKTCSNTVSVVDTTPPEIVQLEEEIYVIQNSDFYIIDYFEIKDNSKEYITEDITKIDTSIEGTQTAQIIAKDASGNETKSGLLTVIVENRDNLHVRNSRFGDSPDTVLRYEDESEFYEKDISLKGNDYIVYNGKVGNMDAFIYYFFNSKDELVAVRQGMYSDGFALDDAISYMENYEEIKAIATEKYGDPIREIYPGPPSESIADSVLKGDSAYIAFWETDEMDIGLFLYYDGPMPFFSYEFEIKEYEFE